MKIIKTIFHPIKSAKRFTRKQVKKYAYIYLAALLPMNFTSVLLTTPVSIDSPREVISYVEKAGVLNFMSGGLAMPTIHGVSGFVGGRLNDLGDAIGWQSAKEYGQSWVDYGNEWFTASGDYSFDVDPQSYFSYIVPSFDWFDWHSPDAEAPIQVEATQSHGPNYYEIVGKAQIPADCANEGIRYTGRIDDKGRIGNVCGTITKKMVDESAGHREKFAKDSAPAGWGHNGKVEITDGDKSYRGYFWNRSHLIADSLGGSATYENLITGTRMQNVGYGSGGMAYTESKTRDFVRNNPSCSVKYSVTPVYSSNEIVPRLVKVDVLSCDGSINESVEVYNDASGFKIDYNTGRFEKE